MRPNVHCLLLSSLALLAATVTCAQDESAAPAAVQTPVVANTAQQPGLQPLASPVAVPATTPELATAESSATLAAAVAGTCTVIDALMMEICAQSPKDAYCQQ